MAELGLTSSDFTENNDPYALFSSWFDDATKSEINDPNAMSVATVDPSGMPNVRILLLKDFTPEGFTFYTNFESAKGQEILASGKVALCFHWKTLRRQVRVRGPVAQVTDAEADAYYNSRPRGSRIGAWASQQSRELSERSELEESVNQYDQKFHGEDVPRPEYWSGFRLSPQSMEFWHDRPYRLHDRVLFEANADNGWSKKRLYP